MRYLGRHHAKTGLSSLTDSSLDLLTDVPPCRLRNQRNSPHLDMPWQVLWEDASVTREFSIQCRAHSKTVAPCLSTSKIPVCIYSILSEYPACLDGIAQSKTPDGVAVSQDTPRSSLYGAQYSMYRGVRVHCLVSAALVSCTSSHTSIYRNRVQKLRLASSISLRFPVLRTRRWIRRVLTEQRCEHSDFDTSVVSGEAVGRLGRRLVG